MTPNTLYGFPHNRKILIDLGPMGKATAVVYSASGVWSCMPRADMESASPLRHKLQAAAEQVFVESEELSACRGVGRTRLAMMVDQTRPMMCQCSSATASWKTDFARSTATVVAFISDSFRLKA